MSQVLIEVRAVEKAYRETKDALPVLRGVDLTVTSGETLSIVGASGTGKSTLLHIIGALDVPSRGEVLFEGDSLFSCSDDQLARFRNEKLGFVFQFHHLLNDFTALENVAMPLLLRGVAEKPRCEKAQQALVDVGLADKAQSRPTELSGGEQQRVAVARAIVAEPVLLLADEPTGNLDARTGDRLMELLFQLNKSRGLTVIYVSHNEALAARAGRRLELHDGKLLEG